MDVGPEGLSSGFGCEIRVINSFSWEPLDCGSQASQMSPELCAVPPAAHSQQTYAAQPASSYEGVLIRSDTVFLSTACRTTIGTKASLKI
jgi:hypothetical protein